MKKILLRSILCVVLFALVFSVFCMVPQSSKAAGDIKVNSITLDIRSKTITAGETLQLTATVNPSNAANKTLVWTSSNNNAATVSDTGLVTAIAGGRATITAKATDGSRRSATCSITVKQYVGSVSLNTHSITLESKGKTYLLRATVMPSTASNKRVYWQSSDTSIATVSSYGRVTSRGNGTCTITCTAADGSGQFDTCAVTAKLKVERISLDIRSRTITAGETLQLTAAIMPLNATDQTLIWSSSNNNAATVSDTGLVTAVAGGRATITVQAADGSRKSAKCTITVKQYADSVTLSTDQIKFDTKGKSYTLKATVLPSTASSKAVTWQSSDRSVATVTSYGKVISKGNGTCIITCTTADGSGKTDTCTVVVGNPPVAPDTITLDRNELTIIVGRAVSLLPTIMPDYASKELTWSSSNNDVATVDSRGKITAVSTGTAEITVKSVLGDISDKCNVTVNEAKIINVYSFTNEVPNMCAKYIALHPDFPYNFKTTIIATTNNLYEPALDAALKAGGANAPDIYCAESAFVLKYTQGNMSSYACPYADLGIDIAAELAAADIAPYTVDIGTRTSDSAIVGLGYQSTGGAFIYRRSIAKDVWGTDDPATIAAKIGPGWDKFFDAAAELKAKGYGIVSGDGDIWHSVENSADAGWINKDGKLYIDPKREAFLDFSRELKVNHYTNNTMDWTQGWYADIAGIGAQPIFGYFGPSWMVNYVMAPNCGGTKAGQGTYADWAVCTPPAGFFWGGTWLMANNSVTSDPQKKEAVKEIIDWITLQCDDDSLQYYWANGTFNGSGGTKDTVTSGTVMDISNGTLAFLKGQNSFDVFAEANKLAKGDNITLYDQYINSLWRDYVRQYAAGAITRDQAIAKFKQAVKDQLGINAA